jgi:hypothetical protein
MAHKVLADPDASDAAKTRAEGVIDSVRAMYQNMGEGSLSDAGIHALAEFVTLPRETITAVQIANLIKEGNLMDSSIELARNEVDNKTQFINANGIPYTDPATGRTTRIDPLSRRPEDIAAIKEHFKANPSDLNTVLNSYMSSAELAYKNWQAESPKTRKLTFTQWMESDKATQHVSNMRQVMNEYNRSGSFTDSRSGLTFNFTGIVQAQGAGTSGEYFEKTEDGGIIPNGIMNSNSDEFRSTIGKFRDGNKDGSKQTEYADLLLKALAEGSIPDGSYIRFNYGGGSVGQSNYQLRDGVLYPHYGTVRNFRDDGLFIPSGYKYNGWLDTIVKE